MTDISSQVYGGDLRDDNFSCNFFKLLLEALSTFLQQPRKLNINLLKLYTTSSSVAKVMRHISSRKQNI